MADPTKQPDSQNEPVDSLTRFRDGLADPILKALFTPPPGPKRRTAAATNTPPPKHSKVTVTIIGPDGRLCVSVALEGPLGTGKRMIVDDVDWRAVTLALGTRWTLRETKPGYCYIVGLGAAAGVTLARRIMGATDGQVVAFRNGDRLDLSRGNLEVVEAGAFVERTFGQRNVLTGAPRS